VIFGPSNAKIYLALGVTDMRKAIDGLAVLIAGKMHLDPLSGSLYVFCNRSRTIIKALYWDRNGFCLWQKRLEKLFATLGKGPTPTLGKGPTSG
jgi:transposase